MARDRYLRQSLGTQYTRIKESRVLMVGAGGIGCELLKNLVLTGYGEVHIVDLDTIDLSNLNRQFLFRHEHIKKSKALVAKESASRFNPNVKIEAHHANIKDPQFNVPWFKQFNIVFNALDNLEARRHVNKLSLAADVPLIDAGTTGWNGQVTVIKKGVSECYDCVQKDPPKTFPVCTIRSTPSQPIHCIVWAKSYLFTEIYGTSEDDAPEMDHSEDAENAPEIQKLKEETQALKKIRKSMGTEEFNKLVFDKVFNEDIDRLRGMEDAWKTRKAPEPLSYDKLLEEASGLAANVAQQDQRPWTVQENFAVFNDSLQRLSKRAQEMRRAPNGAAGDAPPVLTFDKDDVDTLDFVTASANLRSHIFGIDTQSKFDLKQMAGNIIPAIATTNASVAGLCILQAFKIMRDPPDFGKARSVFLSRLPTLSVTAPEPLGRPNPDCSTCSVVHTSIPTDLAAATLDDLVKLLKADLEYTDDFSISTDAGVIYDPDLEDNLPKKLSEFGIEDSSFLTVRDEQDDNPRTNLVLSISAITERADGQTSVSLPGKIEIPRKPKAVATSATNGTATNGVKRKRDAVDAELDEGDHIAKKGKVPPKSNSEAIVIEDDEGFIHLSDDE